MAKPRIGRARLVEREDLSPSLAIFRLVPDEGVPEFVAGQWVTLGLPDPVDAQRVVWRPYSISSPPEQTEYLELYIRRVWKPVPGLLTTLLWELPVGATLSWRGPKGVFTLDDDERRVVMIAGGTGLAPFVSQVRHLRHADSPRELVLLHGASYVEELGYRKLLEDLAASGERFTYLPTVSRPDHERNAGWRGLAGRVEALLARDSDGLCEAERTVGARFVPGESAIMICGYEKTIANVLAELEPRGFVDRRHAREDGSYDIKVDSYG